MTNILDQLGNLGSIPAGVMLEILSRTIDALGQGTEFTGEQIDQLGELEQLFAQKVSDLRSRMG